MVQVCGHSSAVERHVANVTVEGSIPFARSIFFVFFSGGALSRLDLCAFASDADSVTDV